MRRSGDRDAHHGAARRDREHDQPLGRELRARRHRRAADPDRRRPADRTLAGAGARPRRRGRRRPPVRRRLPRTSMYMRGRFFREQATEEGARKAIEYFERAIAEDPGYAAAYAGIADALSTAWRARLGGRFAVGAAAAGEGGGRERALALDPTSPEAHAVVAMIRFNYDWDLAGAERAIRRGPAAQSQLCPGAPVLLRHSDGHGSVPTKPLRPRSGRWSSIRSRRRPARRSASAITMRAVPTEAIDQFRKTLEVTPGFAVAHWGLAQCYRAAGPARRSDRSAEERRAAVGQQRLHARAPRLRLCGGRATERRPRRCADELQRESEGQLPRAVSHGAHRRRAWRDGRSGALAGEGASRIDRGG